MSQPASPDNPPSRLKGIVRWAKLTVFSSRSRSRFTSSADYWEQRYKKGGNSGVGSYGRLAVFKAHVINDFVAKNSITSVIEFGSGDGAQLDLARYPSYIGVDISPTIIDVARRKFSGNPSYRFVHASELGPGDTADLALSLDVIYHLVEDEIFNTYMKQLFSSATRYVIIYSSDVELPGESPHVRQRKFTTWVSSNQKNFQLVEKIPNPYPYSEEDSETSWADFYIFERLQTLPISSQRE